MLPVVAIVGRPNVGKSTLFNRLTRSRDALISDVPGTTRDRQYGEVKIDDFKFIIIDTGGIAEENNAENVQVGELITQQALHAIEDADKLIFLVDGRAGITPDDIQIANTIRKYGKPLVVAVNKTEGLDPDIILADSYELGIRNPIAIAAVHGSGTRDLLAALFPPVEENEEPEVREDKFTGIKFAIVGRPNVGKSTLTNRILGEERVITHDSPGTTRDSIYIPFQRFEKNYTIIDTAGVRKKKNITDLPEKFSVVKTLQAIEDTHVVVFVIDARMGITDQDLKLLGFVLECGKALVISLNKWDGMSEYERDQVKQSIERNLDFVTFARIHFISALHGSGVGNLFESIDEAYESATKKLSTSVLTRLLQKAQVTHSPPLCKGRRVKLRYAHPGGHNPPRIIIHGNQVEALPESYRRFLAAFFQKRLSLFGTPVRVEFISNDNPYAD